MYYVLSFILRLNSSCVFRLALQIQIKIYIAPNSLIKRDRGVRPTETSYRIKVGPIKQHELARQSVIADFAPGCTI